MDVSVPFLPVSGGVGDRTIDADLFRRRGSKVLLKEFVIMTEARRRVGTHAALTRGEISGSTAKIYRQKGTGNARHGSRKAGQLRGGGMIHAKKPRDYGWRMPKKARRAALQAAIRGKLDDGEIRVVEHFDFPTPRTKDFLVLLDRFGIVGGSFVVVPRDHDPALMRSCRNLKGSHYRVVSDLNAYDVLRAHYVLLDEAALRALEERFGHG